MVRASAVTTGATSVTVPTTVDARREPRALEMARDLIAHDVGLLAHLGGERIVAARVGLVDHHRRAASSAHARDCRHGCARARRSRGWRRSAHWSRARAARSRPGTCPRAARPCRRGWRRGSSEMRLSGAQAEADLERSSSAAARAPSTREGDEQRAVEGARSRRRSRRHRRRPRPEKRALLAEIDGAFDARAASGPPGPAHSPGAMPIALAGDAGVGRRGRPPSQSERERSARRASPSSRVDLPVPARQRQLEQRLAERLRELVGVASSGEATSATSVRR